MASFLRFSVPRPPEERWKRRLILGVLGVLVLSAVVIALKGGDSTAPAATPPVPTTAVSTSAAAPASTSTTVDPKAISAAVATLYSHDGPTPQELASAPSSPKALSVHHAKSGGSRSHH